MEEVSAGIFHVKYYQLGTVVLHWLQVVAEANNSFGFQVKKKKKKCPSKSIIVDRLTPPIRGQKLEHKQGVCVCVSRLTQLELFWLFGVSERKSYNHRPSVLKQYNSSTVVKLIVHAVYTH